MRLMALMRLMRFADHRTPLAPSDWHGHGFPLSGAPLPQRATFKRAVPGVPLPCTENARAKRDRGRLDLEGQGRVIDRWRDDKACASCHQRSMDRRAFGNPPICICLATARRGVSILRPSDAALRVRNSIDRTATESAGRVPQARFRTGFHAWKS